MTGLKKTMKSDGIPAYIDLDTRIGDVILDIHQNRERNKYNDSSIPFIQFYNNRWELCWATVCGEEVQVSLWTDEQTREAGITQEMMEKAFQESAALYKEGTYLFGCRFYPISEEIKELIDSWLMQVHERKMNEDLAGIVRGLGLEGNYSWHMDSWVVSTDPDEVLKRDAGRMGINLDTQDDWREQLLLLLDEKLSGNEE